MNYIHKIQQVKFWQALLSALLFLFALNVLLPVMSNASGNILTPDSDFFYNSIRLKEIGATYSHADVLAYTKTRFTYDLLWSLAYGFYMVSTIAYMTKSWKNISLLKVLYTLPIVAMSFDLIENSLCSLYFFEIAQGLTGFLAPLASRLKWLTILVILFTQATLIVISLLKSVKKLPYKP
jgi:uncharacterized membrane protein YeiB